VENKLRDLRNLSRTYAQVQTLMPRINEQILILEHRKQERNKARGVDGVTKDEYGKNLEVNIADLLKRMKAFQYRPYQESEHTYRKQTEVCVRWGYRLMKTNSCKARWQGY